MRGVFRHGPVRHGNIVPEVRRARVAKLAVRRLLPVLRLTVGAVGRAHAAAHFHGVHVERVVVRAGGEPDVLHAVFPVALRAAALFPLPGDAVLQPEIVLERQADDRARAPVAADVDRGVRLEQRQQQLDPCACKGGVVRVCRAPEAAAGEVLGQVVRWVDDQQVCKAARQVRRDRKRVAADGAAAHGVERYILRHMQAAREILRRVLRRKVYGLVAFGFHGVTSQRKSSFFAGTFRSLPWRRPCPRSAGQTGSTFQRSRKDAVSFVRQCPRRARRSGR